MKVLVTGSNGFVGRALVAALAAHGHATVRVVRKATAEGEIAVGDMDGATDWSKALTGVDAVVHLAARVHDLSCTGDQLAAYRLTNVEATLHLARMAAQAGVRRFLFMSSVKVHGEGRDAPYSESDMPRPEDAYGLSKWEAEQGLQALAQTTPMEIVTLRPPLVYGPGVGANMLRLLKLIDRGLPLPLAVVRNRRSMIYIGNLVDAVLLCLTHAAAPGKTFLLSDGQTVSAPELLRALAVGMERRLRLFPTPPSWLRCVLMVIGRGQDWQRLAGSLAVDDSAIRNQLGWTPPFSVEQGLAQTAQWYRRLRE